MTQYSPLMLPRAHQREALAKARGQKAFGYLMDMGTGKSKVILDEFGQMELDKEVSDLLIVAPAGCYRNWDSDRGEEQLAEINKHLSPDLRERIVTAAHVSGGSAANRGRLERVLATRDRPRMLLVNVEALSTVKAAQEACIEFLRPGRAMMVVDESPIIKSPDSSRTRVVCNIGKMAPYRRILTGLIAPNGPMDLYSQFEFLNWRILGHQSFYSFRARYAVLKSIEQGGRVVGERPDGTKIRVDAPGRYGRLRKTQVIVNYRNEDELHSLIAPYTYRKLKEECLDLPPKIYMPMREVELTDEQARVYKELKTTATAQLDSADYVSAPMALTMMMRLHQVLCGHVRDEEGIVRPVSSNRVDSLLEVLGQHPRKAIIWTNYDYSVREISERLRQEYGEHSVAQFWGGNRGTRAEDERRFLGDPRCRWMVSTQSAGGRGNTWTAADLEVYYSQDYDLDKRAQSEDRAHRDGQTMPVTIMDLGVPGTVDTRILHALRKKINLAAVISGDNWREWVV